MGQKFDDLSGFQQTPGMPILLQDSVRLFGTRVVLVIQGEIVKIRCPM